MSLHFCKLTGPWCFILAVEQSLTRLSTMLRLDHLHLIKITVITDGTEEKKKSCRGPGVSSQQWKPYLGYPPYKVLPLTRPRPLIEHSAQ